MSSLKNKYQKQWLEQLRESWAAESFIKLSLGNYKGDDGTLKKILVACVKIKQADYLQFVYRHKTKDITKNYSFASGFSMIEDFLKRDFHIATLFTTSSEIVYENIHNKKYTYKSKEPQKEAQPSKQHDREKFRYIKSTSPYLYKLGIANKNGEILKSRQDKYKQINHFISIVAPGIKQLVNKQRIDIVDMGSGKGYLTFALFDYMRNSLSLNTYVTGVEMRQELVDICTDVAQSCSFDTLSFTCNTIDNYSFDHIDVLIALHACDVATDHAIAKGIQANARLIVTAPCCHKQIRQELEKSKKPHALQNLMRHGIYLEKQAEMLTDSIRTLILEQYGYRVKVMEFVSDKHTPKNVMLFAEKTKSLNTPSLQKAAQIIEDMSYFGIERHALVDLLST